MADYVVRERLPELWRQIEDAHFSYLEIDDSPEKMDQRKKLEGFIMEYLSLVPHSCKFGLVETANVLQSSSERSTFSAYRAAAGWAALARYAANLLSQPWRKEYQIIRLYSGYYKHEVEKNLVGGDSLLKLMGYKPSGEGKLALDGPICPDIVAAVSRDCLIAYVECQLMKCIWEQLWSRGCSRTWRMVVAQRRTAAGDVSAAVHSLMGRHTSHDGEDCGVDIYSNVKSNTAHYRVKVNHQSTPLAPQQPSSPEEQLVPPLMPAQYVTPHMVSPNMIYSIEQIPPVMGQSMPKTGLELNSNPCPYSPMAVPNPYSGFFYAPIQPHPYMMQPMYGPIKHVATMPINGYHCMTNGLQTPYGCPAVPTAQLIELDQPSAYNGSTHRTNGTCKTIVHHVKDTTQDAHKHYRGGSSDGEPKLHYAVTSKSHNVYNENQENIRRNSTLKSSQEGHAPSIPRSDTQPSLSKAKEDGMGTFESWDYVFRNLESQNHSRDGGSRGRVVSPHLDRDSKTLDRTGRDDRKGRYHQTTMDLEDALHAMSLDKMNDEEIFRTAKINEALMKYKLDSEAKQAKANAKKQILADERDKRKSSVYDSGSSPPREILYATRQPIDKVRLISKEDARDKKDMQKQLLNGGNVNGKLSEVKKLKKIQGKSTSIEVDREKMSNEGKAVTKNSLPATVSGTKKLGNNQMRPLSTQQTNDKLVSDQNLRTRLVVTLHDTDTLDGLNLKTGRKPRHDSNGKSDAEVKIFPEPPSTSSSNKWVCGTCTYCNVNGLSACEMCGKSRRAGPETLPLTSGGRECPACTLVNKREASVCEACSTSLKHSPTYI